MLDGKGVPKLFPSLAQSSMVRSDDPTTLIRIVLRGARSVATATEPTAPGMPSFGWQLDDAQVAAVAHLHPQRLRLGRAAGGAGYGHQGTGRASPSGPTDSTDEHLRGLAAWCRGCFELPNSNYDGYRTDRGRRGFAFLECASARES